MEDGFKGNSTERKDSKRNNLQVFTTVQMGAYAKAVIVSGGGEYLTNSQHTLR